MAGEEREGRWKGVCAVLGVSSSREEFGVGGLGCGEEQNTSSSSGASRRKVTGHLGPEEGKRNTFESLQLSRGVLHLWELLLLAERPRFS